MWDRAIKTYTLSANRKWHHIGKFAHWDCVNGPAMQNTHNCHDCWNQKCVGARSSVGNLLETGDGIAPCWDKTTINQYFGWLHMFQTKQPCTPWRSSHCLFLRAPHKRKPIAHAMGSITTKRDNNNQLVPGQWFHDYLTIPRQVLDCHCWTKDPTLLPSSHHLCYIMIGLAGIVVDGYCPWKGPIATINMDSFFRFTTTTQFQQQGKCCIAIAQPRTLHFYKADIMLFVFMTGLASMVVDRFSP